MSIMLIINFIISISAICCVTNIAFSTGASVTSITSVKSKRGIVDSQDFRNNKEQSRVAIIRSNTQITPGISSSQNINSRLLPDYRSASNSQRASNVNPNHKSDSYGSVPQRPLPHAIRQTESAIRNSHIASYLNALNNPYAQKTATSAEKPLDASKSITSQSLQKLQGVYSPSYNAFYQDKPIELSGFSAFEYPSYASISKLISQSALSPTVQVPVYQTSYPLSKVTDYTSSFSTVSSVAPSSDKTLQGTKQKDEATVNVNGKKISVPVIQLHSNPDFSGILPAFGSQPLLLSANYPTETDLGLHFGTGPKFNMALQSRNVSPFLSSLSSFQGQVVPIQTANSSPQFPQYKGASIEVYPVPSNVPKVQGNYESLYSQPQLHFGKEHSGTVQPVNVQQNIVHPSVSTGDILEDAEIINPKNPEPHTPQPDDGEDDERYKHPEKEYERSSENNDAERRPGKYSKESPMESGFKPSTSFPLKEYDERFGKHSKMQSDDENSEDKHSRYKNYSSLEEDEEEKERDSSSEYRAEYAESPKSSRDSYEEEDEKEEESHKKERGEETEQNSYEVKPKHSKYYVKDFEQEFEKSYREELPKHKYVHVKEVPEIDSYVNPKPKQQQKNNNQSPVNQHPEESTGQEFRICHKKRKMPKTSHRDSMAYGSDIVAKKAPKVIYEESFGYKNPEIGKHSKHTKTATTTIDKYLIAKKLPKEDSYLRAKYYKFKNPKNGDKLVSKNKDAHSSTNNWKLNESSLGDIVIRSNTKQLSDPSDRASFYGSSIINEQVRSLTNTEIFRDLTGI